MKEFNEKHIKDLQEANGFVLQDVKGKTVAIGLDSEYLCILDFIADYINDYTAGTLAFDLNFGSTRDMLHQIYDNAILPCESYLLKVRLMGAFNGISADDYAKKLEEKQWHLGDIVEDDEDRRAMIVEDNDGDYVLMDINSKSENAFRINRFFNCADNLTELQDENPKWHKVVED